MYKYIFYIDVDGTLISQNKKDLSKELIDKIVELRKRGNVFVVSTGRSYNEATIIKGIECFDFVSATFGNFIMNIQQNQVEYRGESMSKKVIEKLLPYICNNGFWFYKTDREDKTIFKEVLNKNANVKLVSKEEFLQDMENEIYQFMYFGYLTKEVKDEMTELSIYDMPGDYSDIVLKNASKENVINYFNNLLPEYTSVAIGDSSNDIPMLKKVDISIAMDNAKDEVKKIAKYKTLSVDDDGVLYALNNILNL